MKDKKATPKGNNLTNTFISFLILIFVFMLTTEIASVTGTLRVLSCILFFCLFAIGVFYAIRITKKALYYHDWKFFWVSIFLLAIYVVLLIKEIILLRG